MHRYALRRAEPPLAEEVVNEAFLVAWRRLDTVPEEPLPWLYATAGHVLANRRRDAARHARRIGAAAAESGVTAPRGAATDSGDARARRRPRRAPSPRCPRHPRRDARPRRPPRGARRRAARLRRPQRTRPRGAAPRRVGAPEPRGRGPRRRREPPRVRHARPPRPPPPRRAPARAGRRPRPRLSFGAGRCLIPFSSCASPIPPRTRRTAPPRDVLERIVATPLQAPRPPRRRAPRIALGVGAARRGRGGRVRRAARRRQRARADPGEPRRARVRRDRAAAGVHHLHRDDHRPDGEPAHRELRQAPPVAVRRPDAQLHGDPPTARRVASTSTTRTAPRSAR